MRCRDIVNAKGERIGFACGTGIDVSAVLDGLEREHRTKAARIVGAILCGTLTAVDLANALSVQSMSKLDRAILDNIKRITETTGGAR